MKLQLTPEMSQQKVGSTFQMAVNLSGGTDVFSVPMQVQYDQTKLSLINVDLGDSPGKGVNFLGRTGRPWRWCIATTAAAMWRSRHRVPRERMA